VMDGYGVSRRLLHSQSDIASRRDADLIQRNYAVQTLIRLSVNDKLLRRNAIRFSNALRLT